MRIQWLGHFYFSFPWTTVIVSYACKNWTLIYIVICCFSMCFFKVLSYHWTKNKQNKNIKDYPWLLIVYFLQPCKWSWLINWVAGWLALFMSTLFSSSAFIYIFFLSCSFINEEANNIHDLWYLSNSMKKMESKYHTFKCLLTTTIAVFSSDW